MTDIVKRLRYLVADGRGWCQADIDLVDKAADEIERLRAALRAWQRSNEAMEWLDDDSPLVRQTKEAAE